MPGTAKILLLILVLLGSFELAYPQERGRKRHKDEGSGTMIDKKEASALFIEGTKARILGDINKAGELFTHVLDLDPENDAAYFELAQIYFAREDWSTAAKMAEKAIEIDPSNPYYKLLVLDIYDKAGRKDDMLKICQQLVKQFPDNIDYRYELASAFLMLGKSDEALKVYDHIEEVIGITEEVSMQKQRIYMLLHKPDKAATELEKLVDAFPEDAGRYYSIIAETYMQSNQPDKAASYYEKIIEVDPDNPYVHISLSDYYRKKGNNQKWMEELKKGFANPGLDVETKIRILMAFYTNDEIFEQKKAEVEELSTIILNAHPGNVKALSLNADLLLSNQKFGEARDRYRQVLAADSSRYAVWESLMQSEAGVSDWKALTEESARAIDLFPFQPLPYFFNGLGNLQLKKASEAVRALKSGSKLVTGNDKLLAEFYTYLGEAYQQTGQYELSDENYEKVLKKDPDNSFVLNNYAYFLSLRGSELDKALQMAKRGAELDSLNPANLDTYGWVLYKKGNFEEAKKWVGKAISLSPKEDPDLLEHFGDIQYRLGNKESALEYWLKAVKAGGDTEGLKNKVKDGIIKD